MREASPILMPKLGLTMTEGTIASWHVKAGDQVKTGDLLLVIETEKIATDIEAESDGQIESILVEEGATAPVGAVVARWHTTGASSADPTKATSAAPLQACPTPPVATAKAPARSSVGQQQRKLSTPLARRMARAHGIAWDQLQGSGPRGRIKASDVQRAVAQVPAGSPTSAATTLAGGIAREASAIERTTARRLTAAKQTIPHFYVLADADVTALTGLRKTLNDSGLAIKITFNHLLIVALARALAQMPEFNAIWSDETIVTLDAIDVGIAVDTDRGLYAPVMRNLGGKSLSQIVAEANGVIDSARSGRLGLKDMSGGAITISNIGMYGASHLVPIINPGQSAILGVGAVKQVFRPDADGKPDLRQEVGLVLSCDHRIHNGVHAARFLNLLVDLIQNPLRMLVI